jgi:hypothetical protein
MKNQRPWILLAGILILFLVIVALRIRAQTGENGRAADGDQASDQTLKIVTLLPKDAIPAIYDPRFVEGAEADAQYREGERVLGVELNGDARAYSIPFLSSHEIVNDVVGGVPVAVTW